MTSGSGSEVVSESLPGAAAIHRLREFGVRPRRRSVLTRSAPWIGSILVHGTAVALALVFTWTVVDRIDDRATPLVTLMDFREPIFDPSLAAPVEVSSPAPVSGVAGAPPVEVPAPRAMPPSAMQGMERGTDIAPGDPMARPLAPLALAPPERPASFAGLSASNAGRIAYVVDASGSLTGTFPAIVRELESSLRRLDQRQSFTIIFFQRGKSLAVPPGRMMPAEPAEIARALEWMHGHVFPAGTSNPIPAIKSALSLRPDLVFVLSAGITGEGEFEVSRDEVLQALDRLNPRLSRTGRRRTRIQCVQFLERDPGGTLECIAEAHGGPGAFRFLSRDELGLAPGAPATGASVE